MKLLKYKSIHVVSTLAFAAGLITGCDKGGHTPKNWTPDNMTKIRCASPRAFEVEQVNDVRMNMKNKELIVVKTKDITKGDDKTEANMISVKSIQDFANSQEQVHVALDCTTLSGSYTGPGVNGTVEGKLVRITTTSLAISGKNTITQELTDVQVEKVMPDRKAEKTAYALAANKDAEGYNTLVITISVVGADGKKAVRKIKQWTDLDTVAVQNIKNEKVNAGLNPPASQPVTAPAVQPATPTTQTADNTNAQDIKSTLEEKMDAPATYTIEDYRKDQNNPEVIENLTYEDLIKIASASDEEFAKATEEIDVKLKAAAAEKEQQLAAEAKAAEPITTQTGAVGPTQSIATAGTVGPTQSVNTAQPETKEVPKNADGTCDAGVYDAEKEMCLIPVTTEVETKEEPGMSMIPESAAPTAATQTTAPTTLFAQPMRASNADLNGPVVQK